MYIILNSRIPLVNVGTTSIFLYSHNVRKNQVFEGLVQVCRKKKKCVLLAVELYGGTSKQKIAVGIPNKDLNCFELIDIPPKYQRRNEEKPLGKFEFTPSSGQAQNAKIYLDSLPKINPAEISHPMAEIYHKELASKENLENFYIPKSKMTENANFDVASDGLLLSHG